MSSANVDIKNLEKNIWFKKVHNLLTLIEIKILSANY